MSDEGSDKIKEYSNGEITVVWQPDMCAHSGNCVEGLPTVFNPKRRPWIQIEGSSNAAIMETIKNCPSGALSFRVEDQDREDDEEEVTRIRVRATKNGPFLISGDVEIEDADGNVKPCEGKTTALCRCGASATKPFCDGSHKKVGFWG